MALGVFLKVILTVENPSKISEGLGKFEPGIGQFSDWRDRALWLAWLFSPMIFVTWILIRRRFRAPSLTNGFIKVAPSLLAVFLVLYGVFFADLPLLPHIKSANVLQGIFFLILIVGLVQAETQLKHSKMK